MSIENIDSYTGTEKYLKNIHAGYYGNDPSVPFPDWKISFENDQTFRRGIYNDMVNNPLYQHLLMNEDGVKFKNYLNWNDYTVGADKFDINKFWENSKFNKGGFNFNENVDGKNNSTGQFTYTGDDGVTININPVDNPEYADEIYTYIKENYPDGFRFEDDDPHYNNPRYFDDYGAISMPGIITNEIKISSKTNTQIDVIPQPIPNNVIEWDDIEDKIWKQTFVSKFPLNRAKRPRKILEILQDEFSDDDQLKWTKDGGMIIVTDQFDNQFVIDSKSWKWHSGTSVLESPELQIHSLNEFVKNSREGLKKQRKGYNIDVLKEDQYTKNVNIKKSIEKNPWTYIDPITGDVTKITTEEERQAVMDNLRDRCNNNDQDACAQLAELEVTAYDPDNLIIESDLFTINANSITYLLDRYQSEYDAMLLAWESMLKDKNLVEGSDEWNNELTKLNLEFRRNWGKDGIYGHDITSGGMTIYSKKKYKSGEQYLIERIERIDTIIDRAINYLLTGDLTEKIGFKSTYDGEKINVDDWLHNKKLLLRDLNWEDIEILAGMTLLNLSGDVGLEANRAAIWGPDKKSDHINSIKNKYFNAAMWEIEKTNAHLIELTKKNTTTDNNLKAKGQILTQEYNNFNEKYGDDFVQKTKIFAEKNGVYEEQLTTLYDKIESKDNWFKFMKMKGWIIPQSEIDEYNTIVEEYSVIYEEYNDFRILNKDFLVEYEKMLKESRDLENKKIKLDAKVENHNLEIKKIQNIINETYGEDTDGDGVPDTVGEYDRIVEMYSWNVSEMMFDNNFKVQDDYLKWKESNKIQDGILDPNFWKKLGQGFVQTVGAYYYGLPLAINTFLWGDMDKERTGTSYFSRLDLLEGIAEAYLPGGEAGNMFGSYSTGMYNPDGNFWSYFRGGKGASMFADIAPFSMLLIMQARSGNFQGMYTGAYKMFARRGGRKLSQKWLNSFKIADSAYGQLVMNNYIDGKKWGLDHNSAMIFSHTLSTITGFANMIMPDTNFLGRGVVKKGVMAYVTNLRNTATKAGFKRASLGFVFNMFGELGEEEVELFFGDLLKHSFGLSHTTEFLNWETQKATFAGVMILGGGLAPIQLTSDYKAGRDAVYKNFKKHSQETINLFSTRIESYTMLLNEAKLKNDAVAIKEYSKIIKQLKNGKQYAINLQHAVAVSPANISNDQLQLLAEKEGLINKKGELDKSFHADLDKKIAKIDKRLKESEFNKKVVAKRKANLQASKKYAAALAKKKKVKGEVKEVNPAELETIINEEMLMEEAYYLAMKRKIEKQLKAGFFTDKKGKKHKFTKKSIKEANDILKEYDKAIEKNQNRAVEGSNQFGTIIQRLNGDFIIYLNAEKQMLGTAAHEVMHALLFKTLKGNEVLQDKLGDAVTEHTNNLGDKSAFWNRMGGYGKVILNKKGEKVFVPYAGKFGEETITVMSESIIDGSLKFNENFMTKIGDIIRRYFQKKYPNSRLGKIKFNTGRDVFNFIKDYKHSIDKNYINQQILDIGVKGAEGKLLTEKAKETKTKEEKPTGETKIYESRDIDSDSDIKSILDDFVQNVGGGQKYLTKKEFEDSEDYTKAWLTIENSNLLDGSIRKIAVKKGIPQMILDNPAAMKNFTKMVKENVAERFAKNFDPAKNESLFGWLFGGKTSPLEGAVLDIIKDEAALLNTFPYDIEPGLVDVIAREEAFEVEPTVEGPQTFLNTIKADKNTINEINRIVKEADINLKNINYKGVKKLLIGKGAALKNIMDTVGEMFGVPTSKIAENKDLDSKQRKKAQNFIDKNAQQLIDMLPEGMTASGKATGIAPTLLANFYEKGTRVKMSETGSGQGLPGYKKNKNINIDEFKNAFGIKAVGVNINNKSVDGIIRSLITQTGMITANQAIRENAINNATDPLSVINLVGDGKSEIMFSKDPMFGIKLDLSFSADASNMIRLYGTPEGNKIMEHAEDQLANVVEQLALQPNRNLGPGKNYNKHIKGQESTPQYIKDNISPGGRLSSEIKIYDNAGNGYGLVNEVQNNFVEEVTDLGATYHPDIPSKTIQHLHGIKDSGSEMYNGEMTYNRRSINPKAHPDAMAKMDQDREQNRKREEKWCKDRDIDFESFKYAQPMIFAGRVKNIIVDILSQKGIKNKIKKLKEHVGEIQNINTGNRAILKYYTLKLKEAKISSVTMFHLGSLQTNIIEGVRSLSTFEWLYLVEGKQFPTKTITRGNRKGELDLLPRPPLNKRSKKEYYKSSDWNNYVAEWETVDGYQEIYKENLKSDLAKKHAEEHNITIEQAAENLTISDLLIYNEHVGPSAKTNAEISNYVYSNGQDRDIDIIGDDHKSFFSPSYLASRYLDAKIKDPVTGKMVDNKISNEGYFRLTKFAGEKRKNIFHITADIDTDGNVENDVSDYIAKNEDIVGIYNNIVLSFSKDASSINTTNNLLAFSKDAKITDGVKGVSIWDFDHTLATTKSGVLATIPNPNNTPKPGRKVIFLAGGAGSGKSNVIKQLGLEEKGFKIINSDRSLEWLKKNDGLPANMNDLTEDQLSTLGKLQYKARQIAKNKMMKYQGKGDGIVVDSTGGSSSVMAEQVKEFKNKGYDVQMVFVETSVKTALERNRAREERSLLDKIIIRNHEKVQGNKETFKRLFGNNFAEVKTDNLKQGDPMPSKVSGKVNNFVNSYEKIRLDAEQFALQGAGILAQGGKLDFSEFNKVVKGEKGPLFGKAMNRANKFGTKDQFILTARPAESAKAIREFLKSQGLDIPLKNITGLANSTAKAKADWIANNIITKGYNDVYFADDALANVKAVDNMLKQYDVKRSVQQAKIMFSKDGPKKFSNILDEGGKDLNLDFNIIVEEAKGVAAKKEFSAAKARQRGMKKGKFKFFIPPSAEDFEGLIYSFLGKGKQGEQHHAWFKKYLFDPYGKAIRMLNLAKQSIAVDIRALKKAMPDVKAWVGSSVFYDAPQIPGTEYTYEQAIRVYLWNKNGHSIPGLTKTDKNKLINTIKNNPLLKKYADSVDAISSKAGGYAAPGTDWLVGNISVDLNDALKNARDNLLAEWKQNVDVVFSEKNLNKIEAIYGKGFRDALQDILWRMEKGTNRRYGDNKIVNGFMDWINGSIGATMFINIRSAVLQGLSTVNFINWHDNNVFKAGLAFANQPQFWTDFSMIFNSNWLRQRRSGLQHDVNAEEMIKAITNSKNPFRAAIGYLLQKGFKPTQIMDSFAIASGGATMYRNRVKTYLKQGLNQKTAEDKAFEDLQEIAEATQQSARPDRISQQQASVLGKLILAFQNTPMQYMRLTKKAFRDLINGRGDWKTNLSKIIYYSTVQNLIFYSLQSALFASIFGDDDEEELTKDKKKVRTINGMLDSILRGTGIYGAVVSTAKNMIIKFMEQEKKGYHADHAYTLIEMLNLSPPIGIKARKLYGATQTWEFNRDVIKYMSKTDIDNPIYSAFANLIEATTNAPTARLYNKMKNVREALDSDNETWQRVALFLGWNRWDLGIQDDEIMDIKNEISNIKKIEKRKKILETKYPGKSEEEIIRLEKGADIYKLNKDEQTKTLLDLGLDQDDINELKKEKDRVDKILYFYDKNPNKTDSLLQVNEGYIMPEIIIKKKDDKDDKKKDDKKKKKDDKRKREKDKKNEFKKLQERFLKDQANDRKNNISEDNITCAAVKSDGQTRCGKKIKVAGSTYCTIHEKVDQNKTGEKYRCLANKKNGERCKKMTANKNRLCYYHD